MPKSKRVLFVLNAAGGGASAGIYEALKRLPPDTIQPYAVVPPGTPLQLEAIRPLFVDIHATPLAWWNRPDVGLLRRLAQTAGHRYRGITLKNNIATIKSCIKNWDIDVVHSGTSLTLSGALAAYDLEVPHIWHIKEAIGHYNRVQFPMPDAKLVSYMSRLSMQIVAMSEYIAEVFKKHGVENILVVPDGVDLEPYQGNPQPYLRTQLNLPNGHHLVGMVASFVSRWKQHDLFIEMAAIVAQQYPNVHFVIIGGKPSPNARWPYDLSRSYYQHIEQLAHQKVEKERLTFLSHHTNPAEIMASLDILVHPCAIEPFGRIAIEAMAARVPVVGPDTGGIAETILHQQTGILVPANNPQAMADAVLGLLQNPAQRQSLGSRGYQHVEANYGIDLHVERLLALYDNDVKQDIRGTA